MLLMSLVLELHPYISCFASHRLVDESKDERTYARGRSRIEMKRQLIKFCEEGGEGKRDWQAVRNLGQVQWERLSES